LTTFYAILTKEFVVETDHNNLRWIEHSAVPKVIRWRIYLQGFNFCIRHIAGRQNVVADWASRFFAIVDVSEARATSKRSTEREQAIMESAGRGHCSTTSSRGIKFLTEWSLTLLHAALFQKDRLGMAPQDMLPEVTRHNKVPHARHTVGVDVLTVNLETPI
jgi:hypothetical protein